MWHKDWETEFLFALNILKEAQCLVCGQIIKKKCEYSLKRHYRSCHADLQSVTGGKRESLLKKLMQDFKAKNNIRLIARNEKYPISGNKQRKASYAIAIALAKKGRPFEDGEYFKDICELVLPIFGDAGLNIYQAVKELSLSARSITRRTEDIGLFIEKETNERLKRAKYISVCFDEGVDISETKQMIICVRAVDAFFNHFEAILKLHSFSGVATGETIYHSFNENVLNIVDKNKISSICTNGSAAMVELCNGFVDHLNKAGINVPTFHCIIHQQALFAKALGLNDAMKIAVKIINRLKGEHKGLTHRKLIEFLNEVNDDYKDKVLFTDVKWLSRGKALEKLFDLRVEIIYYLRTQGTEKDVEILNDLASTEFQLDLGFLTDITLQINSLNLILRGENKTLCELFQAVSQFSKKLSLLKEQLDSNVLDNFPKLNLIYTLHPNETKLQSFSTEMGNLIDNFKMRFKDIFELEWAIDIFNSPLDCDLKNVPQNIQDELIQLRQDLLIPMGSGLDFWKNICRNRYAACRDLALYTFSMFSTTYICESSFSAMSQVKNQRRSKLTNRHLEILLKIKRYDKEINIDKLLKFLDSQNIN